MRSGKSYIFDTTCLNYFGRVSQLALLKTQFERCYIPKEVREEIVKGISDYPSLAPKLQPILAADWIEALEITEIGDLALFASLKRRWGKKDRHDGEAAVLVLAKRDNLIAVIDEAVGRKAARDLRIPCIGTVSLLARFAALSTVDTDTAWSILEQMTNLPSGPFRCHIRERSEFEQEVGKFVARLESGLPIL